MPTTTPVSRSKTAALSRILDLVPRGYQRYTSGTIRAAKAERLAHKFHARYAIGATPAQRLVRKRRGDANALLVLYWPENAEIVHWLLLATEGNGLEQEDWLSVTSKSRLNWLGYELVRYPTRGRTSWTWRRPKVEMAEHYVLLASLSGLRNEKALQGWLERLSRQPGFHGVRQQTWSLYQEARRRGNAGELPVIFHVQKMSHGEPMQLTAR
ncbi:hypothetical protein [Ferribacterium limneticum]|uniref:hypothetical protein n=1 Tax=Ferribacterium limneticum TaxID=76259 RepID=UPI001CF8B530|nr:hypothetical protein [Ferribacterium limneticum]UCV23592.1 hypothetical protein KI613_03365 [Ferribacterium limneticum]